jgi:hypothetical protein
MSDPTFDSTATAAADETGTITPSSVDQAMAAPDPYANLMTDTSVQASVQNIMGSADSSVMGLDAAGYPSAFSNFLTNQGGTFTSAGNSALVGLDGNGLVTTPTTPSGGPMDWISKTLGFNTDPTNKDPTKNDVQKYALLAGAGLLSGVSASYTASKARAIQQQEANTQQAYEQSLTAQAQAKLDNQAAMSGVKATGPAAGTGLLYNPAALTPLAQRKTK